MVELRNKKLWVKPNGAAAQQAEAWRNSNPDGAKIFDVLSQIPTANWMTTNSDGGDVDWCLSQAGEQLVTFVLYNIPLRDLGNYSAGGASSASAYRSWIDKIVSGIKNRVCIVVIEPDALAMASRMHSDKKQERYDCIRYAVTKVTEAGGLAYIDAGGNNWTSISYMSDVLIKSGVTRARGIAVNCAHFQTTKSEHLYATGICEKINALHGTDLHYVIDTSRNGRGPYDLKPGEDSDARWCNPIGAGFGIRPKLNVNDNLHPQCDALLWLKSFSSDGSREGAPPAGTIYPQACIRMYWNAIPRFSEIDF